VGPSVADTTEDGTLPPPSKPHADSNHFLAEIRAGGLKADAPDRDNDIVDGDAATHLEALVSGALAPAQAPAGVEGQAEGQAEGLPLELVGQHLRLSGTVTIGFHRRLSDFVNANDGLIQLRDVTVLRRNGDPTKVTSPSIWVNPDEVTLIGQDTDIGQATDIDERETQGLEFMVKRPFHLIVVTPGHTLTGDVHLTPEAILSAFLESRFPVWIPMTDVQTRSLADRRVISRYGFALVNRRHLVAATELQPDTVRGRGIL
jgi:hypothetical protein